MAQAEGRLWNTQRKSGNRTSYSPAGLVSRLDTQTVSVVCRYISYVSTAIDSHFGFVGRVAYLSPFPRQTGLTSQWGKRISLFIGYVLHYMIETGLKIYRPQQLVLYSRCLYRTIS